jgi:hypothetical protein
MSGCGSAEIRSGSIREDLLLGEVAADLPDRLEINPGLEGSFGIIWLGGR